MFLTWLCRIFGVCGAEKMGIRCNEDAGHEGDHTLRRDDGELLARWPKGRGGILLRKP